MNKLFAFAENPREAIAALVLLGALMFLPGFFTVPPIDRDEARFAQASKQMIETGNYWDIHFQNEVRYKKPIGIYWLQVASTKIFGAPPYNEIWTYRVPSLLGAITALVFTYLIGRTLVSAPVGFGAALFLASSIILAAEARLAKTDAMLLAVTLLAMWQLAKVYMNLPASRVMFWLAIAAGILIKGPIILMVVGLTVITLTVCHPGLVPGSAVGHELKFSDSVPTLRQTPAQGRGDRWLLLKQLRPLMGMAIVALCVAPWLIAITVKSNGLFWQESVGHDMLAKVSEGQESHGLPFGMHTALLPLLFLPAVVPVIYGLIHGWKTRRERVTQFLLAWILPCWLIFEIVPTKLPHYTLPMYPAIAILAAAALARTNFSDRRLRLAFAIPLAIALTLNISLLGVIAPNLENFWLSHDLHQQIKIQRLQDRPFYIVDYSEPSSVFLNGTQTKFLHEGEDAAIALHSNSDAIVAISEEETMEFIQAARKYHLRVEGAGVMRGLDLGRGKWQVVSLYRRNEK